MNWDEAELLLHNMTEAEVPMDAICRPAKPGHVLINKRPFESLVDLCDKFHGQTSVVRSEEMQAHLSDLYMRDEACRRQTGGLTLLFAH